MVTGADVAPGRTLSTSVPAGRRVGIFGGTFDPPHVGHVSVVRDVADALDLDEVVWIPAFRSPHKPEGAQTPAALRLEMVRAAVRADPRFRVDDCEIAREGSSYTVDTLRELRAGALRDAEEIVLIMGADQYAAFDRWREPDVIREIATVAVMDRDGVSASDPVGARRVPVGRVDISSTEVRRRASRGASIEEWVPEGVADVIAREGLYSPSSYEAGLRTGVGEQGDASGECAR